MKIELKYIEMALIKEMLPIYIRNKWSSNKIDIEFINERLGEVEPEATNLLKMCREFENKFKKALEIR